MSFHFRIFWVKWGDMLAAEQCKAYLVWVLGLRMPVSRTAASEWGWMSAGFIPFSINCRCESIVGTDFTRDCKPDSRASWGIVDKSAKAAGARGGKLMEEEELRWRLREHCRQRGMKWSQGQSRNDGSSSMSRKDDTQPGSHDGWSGDYGRGKGGDWGNGSCSGTNTLVED